MVRTTFKDLLKGTKYDFINRAIVETVLTNIGYVIKESPYGIKAIKYKGLQRYHFIIETTTEGRILMSSEIVFHRDLEVKAVHSTDYSSEKVKRQFEHFQSELIEQLRLETERPRLERKRLNKISSSKQGIGVVRT